MHVSINRRRIRPSWQRGQLTAFVVRHRSLWDLVSAALTIIYVALAFRQDSATPAESYAVWGLAVLFLSEFAARCYDAPSGTAYLKSHWLDLITAVPVPGIPGFRILRLLRLLRFMNVGIKVRRMLMDRGWNDSGLIWPTLFLFWIASGLALWLVEHDAHGSTIKSFPDAMTAAFLTASTLGLGGSREHLATSEGQIISGLIVFMALGLWGFASGRLTQIWLQGRKAEATIELADVHRELRAIRDEMSVLAIAVTNPAMPTFRVIPPDAEGRRRHEVLRSEHGITDEPSSATAALVDR
jgi:hypothetical protein